jgi:hypothetical protein
MGPPDVLRWNRRLDSATWIAKMLMLGLVVVGYGLFLFPLWIPAPDRATGPGMALVAETDWGANAAFASALIAAGCAVLLRGSRFVSDRRKA